MAFALALFALLTVILLFDRIRRTRATRSLLNALTTAGTSSGDPFFHALAANLGRAFKADPDAIANLSNVFKQRAFLETKRRQSDQALQASEAKTRAILQALPDLMFVQDRTASSSITTPPWTGHDAGRCSSERARGAATEASRDHRSAFRRVVDSGQAEAGYTS
jgi:PAS domain-containing protein